MSARTNNSEQQRIAGALAIIKALRGVEKAIENEPTDVPGASVRDSVERYYGRISADTKLLADTAGAMPPYQQGAFLALAEYIHFTMTTGTPELAQWLPEVAKTAEQYAADIESMIVDGEADEARFASCPA